MNIVLFCFTKQSTLVFWGYLSVSHVLLDMAPSSMLLWQLRQTFFFFFWDESRCSQLGLKSSTSCQHFLRLVFFLMLPLHHSSLLLTCKKEWIIHTRCKKRASAPTVKTKIVWLGGVLPDVKDAPLASHPIYPTITLAKVHTYLHWARAFPPQALEHYTPVDHKKIWPWQ